MTADRFRFHSKSSFIQNSFFFNTITKNPVRLITATNMNGALLAQCRLNNVSLSPLYHVSMKNITIVMGKVTATSTVTEVLPSVSRLLFASPVGLPVTNGVRSNRRSIFFQNSPIFFHSFTKKKNILKTKFKHTHPLLLIFSVQCICNHHTILSNIVQALLIPVIKRLSSQKIYKK